MNRISCYFSFYGKMNQLEYFKVYLACNAIAMASLSFILFIYEYVVQRPIVEEIIIIKCNLFAKMILAAIIILLSFWVGFASVVKRLRDMGSNPWLALIPFIFSFTNLSIFDSLFSIALMFYSSDTSNQTQSRDCKKFAYRPASFEPDSG